jgi:hypothetical protein
MCYTIKYSGVSGALSLAAMRTMSQIFACRAGRIAFGLVLLVGVASLATAAWSGSPGPHGATRPGAMRLIVLTWLIAVLAGAVVRAIAARLRWQPAPEALFAESVMVPTAGIALLLPITLHLPVVLLIADASAFDVWVMASLWITGLAHAVFAGLSVLRAHQLVAGKPAVTPRTVYVATLITSCVPFVLLWAIPPLLVAITALPFVPMLRAMQRLVDRERAEISAAPMLPRAVAVPPRREA